MTGDTVTIPVYRDRVAQRPLSEEGVSEHGPEVPVWDTLLAQAYQDVIDRYLRNEPLWRQFITDTTPGHVVPRRTKIRRKIRAGWNGFRYRLAKRIYDFPEDEW